ncbi:MAG TPA: CAP domain-containing protein [Thermoanaerobaculia bacterium]|nr:CAP domain-containing protein [Thermoanaerobaculia bacterium]
MKRFLITAAILFFASPVAHSDIEETRTTLRAHILRLINRDRQLYHLPPVELDLDVSAIGDDYCRRQIDNGTTGHFTTDGLAPYMRYSFAGGKDAVSENAAAWSANYAFNDRALYEMARRSEDAMMSEMPPNDGHKRTILDPHATHVGIGMAWQRGEFRLVHEFVRRYINWTKPLPAAANVDDVITIAGSPIRGTAIEAITVHHEPLPARMSAFVASAIPSYSLPKLRKEYLPRLKSEVRRDENGRLEYIRREYPDGTRGDFYLGKSGDFSFDVPFTDGPGVYTVVVWVRRPGFTTAVSASSVSIRVEESLQNVSRASAAGR